MEERGQQMGGGRGGSEIQAQRGQCITFTKWLQKKVKYEVEVWSAA